MKVRFFIASCTVLLAVWLIGTFFHLPTAAEYPGMDGDSLGAAEQSPAETPERPALAENSDAEQNAGISPTTATATVAN